MPTIFFFFLRDGLKGLASAKRCQELIKTTYLHQHIPALQKQTQPWDGAGSQEPLTLYRWENSISRGVRRDRGNGFTVTEMTLELRTVLFLGRRGQREALEDFCESHGNHHWWRKVWCAQGFDPIIIKYPQRYLLLMGSIFWAPLTANPSEIKPFMNLFNP